MHLTLVCPHLEYASQVWNTSKLGEIDSISLILDVREKVQKSSLRVCSKQWTTSYDVYLIPVTELYFVCLCHPLKVALGIHVRLAIVAIFIAEIFCWKKQLLSVIQYL